MPQETFLFKLAVAINDIHARAELGPRGLADLPRATLKTFSILIDSIDSFPRDGCVQRDGGGHRNDDVATSIGDGLWSKIADLHSVAVRQLIDLTHSGSSRAVRLEILLGRLLFIFIKINALNATATSTSSSCSSTSAPLGGRLALALVKSESFQCYSRLLAAWRELPPESMAPKLRLVAQFSLIFSSCMQIAVADRPVAPDDHSGTALYEACLKALTASQFLEHMSCVLLRTQDRAHQASRYGHLPPDIETNVRTGIMEISGCVVSALHGIAGKRGVMESSSCDGTSAYEQQLEGEAQQVEPSAVEGGRATGLLRQAQAILSGPCLQFMLGREIVASTLRLNSSDGANRFGLDDAMLPELAAGTGQAGAPNPPRRVLTDRLLSRLGAASVVWHLLLTDGRQPEGTS